MIHKELAILLSRKLSGEASLDELEKFDAWVRNHPEDQFFIELMQAYWRNPASFPLDEKLSEERIQHILNTADTMDGATVGAPQKPFWKTKTVKRLLVAASVSLLLVSAGWLWQKGLTKGPQPNMQEIFAARGTKSHLVLPDGSEVWLNSDSRIYFNKDFNSPTREITLNGEAFFRVTKDTSRPFVVHTSAIDVKVLGTSFNVKAYENDQNIETTLITGSIEVKDRLEPQNARILLRPKEKLVFIKPVSGPDRQVESVGKGLVAPAYEIKALPAGIADSSVGETSWVQNRLVFDGDSFQDLAIKMERWFNVQVVFKNQRVSTYRLRGAFENESLEQALKGLQLIVPFEYRVQGRIIEIY